MEWLTDSVEGTATWLKAHAEELAGTTEPMESHKWKISYLCVREVRALMDSNSRHDFPKRARKAEKKGNRNEAQGTK